MTISVPGSSGGAAGKGESLLGGWTQTGRGLLGQHQGPSRGPLTSWGKASRAGLWGMEDSGPATDHRAGHACGTVAQSLPDNEPVARAELKRDRDWRDSPESFRPLYR